jgi:hypothetical protein
MLLILFIVVIFTPKITFPARKPLDPARDDATFHSGGPVVRLIVVVWDNPAIGNLGNDPSGAIEDSISNDASISESARYSNLGPLIYIYIYIYMNNGEELVIVRNLRYETIRDRKPDERQF